MTYGDKTSLCPPPAEMKLTVEELDELYSLLAGDRMEPPFIFRGVTLDQVKAIIAAAREGIAQRTPAYDDLLAAVEAMHGVMICHDETDTPLTKADAIKHRNYLGHVLAPDVYPPPSTVEGDGRCPKCGMIVEHPHICPTKSEPLPSNDELVKLLALAVENGFGTRNYWAHKCRLAATALQHLSDELAKEEKAHEQSIEERDAAEEALAQAYYLVTGESPEWSNLFGYKECIGGIDEAQRMLRLEVRSLSDELERVRGEVETLRDERDQTTAELHALLDRHISIGDSEMMQLLRRVNKQFETQIKEAQAEAARSKAERNAAVEDNRRQSKEIERLREALEKDLQQCARVALQPKGDKVMTPCKILATSYAIDTLGRPLGGVSPHSGPWAAAVKFHCQTHNMTCDGPMHDGYLCPIGRIEEATEKAIKEIESCSTHLKAK